MLAALACAGCSLRPQTHPVPLPTTEVTVAGDAGGAGDGAPQSSAVTVFWLRNGQLEASQRRSRGVGVGAALAALAAGPTAAGRRAGLTSAMPPGTHRLTAQVSRGVVTVNVPSGFDRLRTTAQVTAMAQLVYTVMAQPGIVGLAMADATGPVDVPVDGGRLVPGPVTRIDYRLLAPR